ncbi:MAG: hypothetical protein JEZ06_04510 [Anaerolineaceae bacterium]|nr:hypothetical protein [Anaerolineaceae bacterium]
MVISYNDWNELINRSNQVAAKTLSDLLDEPVAMEVEDNDGDWLQPFDSLSPDSLPETFSSISLDFFGDIKGSAHLILKEGHDSNLVKVVAEYQEIDLGSMDDPEVAVLTEIGNMLLNASVGTITNAMGHKVEFKVPVTKFRDGKFGNLASKCLSKAEKDCETLFYKSRLMIGTTGISAMLLVLFVN